MDKKLDDENLSFSILSVDGHFNWDNLWRVTLDTLLDPGWFNSRYIKSFTTKNSPPSFAC